MSKRRACAGLLCLAFAVLLMHGANQMPGTLAAKPAPRKAVILRASHSRQAAASLAKAQRLRSIKLKTWAMMSDPGGGAMCIYCNCHWNNHSYRS
jgi:hypothetical protein